MSETDEQIPISSVYDRPVLGCLDAFFAQGDIYDATVSNIGAYVLHPQVVAAFVRDMQAAQRPEGSIRTYKSIFSDSRLPYIDRLSADDKFIANLRETGTTLYGERTEATAEPHHLVTSHPLAGLRHASEIAGANRHLVVQAESLQPVERLMSEVFSGDSYRPSWLVRTVEVIPDAEALLRADITARVHNSSLQPLVLSPCAQPRLVPAITELVRAFYGDGIRLEAMASDPSRFFEVMHDMRSDDIVRQHLFVSQTQSEAATALFKTCIEAIRTEVQEGGLRALQQLKQKNAAIDLQAIQDLLLQTVKRLSTPLLQAYAEFSLDHDEDQQDVGAGLLVKNEALESLVRVIKKDDLIVMAHDERPDKDEGGYAYFNWKNEFFVTVLPATVQGYSWLRVDQLTSTAQSIAATSSLQIAERISLGSLRHISFS